MFKRSLTLLNTKSLKITIYLYFCCMYKQHTYIQYITLLLKLHNSFKAMVSKWLQCWTAHLLFHTGHFVVVTVTLRAWWKINSIRGVDWWIFIKVVVGSEDDAPTIAYSNRVGDVFCMWNVKESNGHPGNQVLEKTWMNRDSIGKLCCTYNTLFQNKAIGFWLIYWVSYLIVDGLIIFNIFAKVNIWGPHVVLTIKAAASLLFIFMLGYSNFIPTKEKENKEISTKCTCLYILCLGIGLTEPMTWTFPQAQSQEGDRQQS